MKEKLSLLMIVIFLSVFISCGQNNHENTMPTSSVKHELKIMKIGGIWKVVNETDSTKTKVVAKRKDTIIWTADGTDAYFQFPDSIFKPVGPHDSLQNGYTKFLRNGKKFSLKVKANAPLLTYIYAVFCTADSTFAQGDSPPKIILK
jgi:hypothetical protein